MTRLEAAFELVIRGLPWRGVGAAEVVADVFRVPVDDLVMPPWAPVLPVLEVDKDG
jgi:hypothetical protein